MSVTEDDPRYLEWPDRKPTLEQRKLKKLTSDPLGTLGETVTKSVSRSVGQTLGRAGGAAGKRAGAALAKNAAAAASAAVTLGKLGLVGAAGYAAYWLTSKLQSVRFKTWDDLQYELANRYRHARQAAEAEYGRPLTADETASFTRWYKAERDRYMQLQREGRAISSFKFGD